MATAVLLCEPHALVNHSPLGTVWILFPVPVDREGRPGRAEALPLPPSLHIFALGGTKPH